MRTAEQVAKRAVILGTIACRASIEVDDHARVASLSQQILPWLSKVGCDDEIDPIERDLFATPLGQLSESQWTDANWAGEAALLFCWMLSLAPALNEASQSDPSIPIRLLDILRPTAADAIRNARLRKQTEIEDLCGQIGMIRSLLQESRLQEKDAAILRDLNVRRLSEAGLTVTDDAAAKALAVVGRMTSEQRDRLAGCYFVREHAALWFFSDRGTYFDFIDDCR
jgi:hypothetical protein